MSDSEQLGLLPTSLRTTAASLRNRIAHGYASVDLARLWAEIPLGLDALDEYVTKVAALI